jgi:hypothetical protein
MARLARKLNRRQYNENYYNISFDRQPTEKITKKLNSNSKLKMDINSGFQN